MLAKEELLHVLNEWNVWAQDVSKFAGIPRKETLGVLKHMGVREIVLLYGVRRSGKSTIMFQLMEKMLQNGTARKEQFLYINFEERAFINELDCGLIDRILDAYREGINPGGKAYLFLDEVQRIRGWEQWARSTYDKKRDLKIIVSGSSSKLLGRELGAALTGRYVSFAVMPLSFPEFASFLGHEYGGMQKALLEKHKWKALFSDYLKCGGFPEAVLREESLRKRLLNDYFDGIISKDIEERHEVRDSAALKRICAYLLANISKMASYNSIKNSFGVSVDTAKEYIGYMSEAFLVFENPCFSYSQKEQAARQRKVYCIDTGLRNANSVYFTSDTGRLVENAVYLALMKDGGEIFYWKEKREVDFVQKQGGKLLPINACYGESVDEREIEGLLSFMGKFKVKEGLVLTQDKMGEEKHAEGKIMFVPAWLWLLEKNQA